MSQRRVKCSDISESEILRACRDFHAGLADTPDVALAEKYPAKVVLTKMKRMAERGLLDYGVSLRTAWVVPSPKERDDLSEQIFRGILGRRQTPPTRV